MNLSLIAVGRWRDGPEKALFDRYLQRLSWPLALREVEERRKLAPTERLQREGHLLLAQIPKGATIVALDETGRVFDSQAFAAVLGAWRDRGIRDVAFVIGGADGHDDQVRQKASLLLSLGSMTWPHLMVRALLAEQLYRANCILSGHPYHRE